MPKRRDAVSNRSLKFLGQYFSLFYRKYKNDKIKQNAGLLTYYSFMGIFPLGLFLLTIVNLILPSKSTLSRHFMKAIAQVIPVIGKEFFHNLNYNRPISIGLLSTLIIGLIGAFAWISEFRLIVNQIWNTAAGSLGGLKKLRYNARAGLFLGVSVLTMCLLFYLDLFTFHGSWISIAALIASCGLNSVWWFYIFRLSLSRDIKRQDIIPTAVLIGVAVQLMARFGGFLLSYELKHLQSLYGSFAIILGLAIWLYILTQLILIIAEFVSIVLRQRG